MSTFKRSQRKYVKKAYRVRNWREYEAGLRDRGSLTVWISLSDGKLANWDAPRVLATHLIHGLVSASVETRARLCGPLIVVMKPAENGYRLYTLASRARMAFPRRDLLADSLVRSRIIEVGRVLRQRSLKMVATQNNGVVEALAPDASKEALAERIGLRSVVRRSNHLDCDAVGDVVELGPEFRVVVANQKPRRCPDRRCVAQLLSYPPSGR